MKTQTLPSAQPKTDDEYRQEIDRMAEGIRAMLNNSRRSIERSKRMAEENTRILEDLEQRLSCGKN